MMHAMMAVMTEPLQILWVIVFMILVDMVCGEHSGIVSVACRAHMQDIFSQQDSAIHRTTPSPQLVFLSRKFFVSPHGLTRLSTKKVPAL
jgi:hypothetical protein